MDQADKANCNSQQGPIPLFLLDAQHPRLVENRHTLESLPDLETLLHSLPGTGIGHGCDGILTIPQDLFHQVRISNRSRPGDGVLERLREMRRCPPAALARIRSLRVDLEQSTAADGPTDELADLFADVLAALPALEALTWGMPPELSSVFNGAFEARGLRLRSVVRLEPGPGCEFLVAFCPNLKALECFAGSSWSWSIGGDPGLSLVHAGAAAPGLTRFSVWAELGASLIQGILPSPPRPPRSLRTDR